MDSGATGEAAPDTAPADVSPDTAAEDTSLSDTEPLDAPEDGEVGGDDAPDADDADDASDADAASGDADSGSGDADEPSGDADETGAIDAASDVVDAPADTGPPIVCSSVAINDASFGTSKEIRQGYGAVQLNVTGSNLASITGATLLGSSCTIVLKTATSALLGCNVPHGAALGGANLVLSSASTSGTCTNAVTVTRITTDGDHASASDTSGLGTPFRPFKSISKSLSVARAGDIVFVGSMTTLTYGPSSTQTSETLVPIGTSTNPYAAYTANVAAGVTIEGESASAPPRLVGTKNAAYVALRLAGNATIRNLIVDGFRFGISANAGTVTLQNVSIRNPGLDGLVVFGTANATVTGPCELFGAGGRAVNTANGASVTMTGCTVRNNDLEGIAVHGTSQLTGTSLKVHSNGKDLSLVAGVYVEASGTVRLTSSEVYGNYQGGIFGVGDATIELTTTRVYNNGKQVGNTTKVAAPGCTQCDGVKITDGKELTIVGGQIYDNGASGVGAYESANYTGLTVTLNGVNIQNNYFDGLRFNCDGRLVVRNTIFEDNVGNGVQIENTPTLVDFGNASAPGNNTFRRLVASTTPGSAGRALLGDFRPARVAPDGVIVTVRGSTFQSTSIAPGVKVGPTSQVASGQLLYEIANSNNRIQFY